MRHRHIGVMALLLLSSTLFAQKKHKTEPAGPLSADAVVQLQGIEDTLGVLGYAIVNDSIEAERFAACKVFITTLVRALRVENSFSYPFEQLKSVSILTPPDSTFRIFTWQLFVNDSTYRYYGAIQMNEKQLKLYPLIDRSFELSEFPAYEALAADKWYGALYYNIRQFDTRQGKKYLLLGFDAFEFFEKRKLIDVISFDKEGKPHFGAPVLDHGSDVPAKNRMYLQYSADAKVKLNWDEQYQMIIMDHLIPWDSPYGRGSTYVPDGSYDAYKFEKGKWKYIDKVFDDKQKDVPMPEPVLDTRKEKDIVGKKKGIWGRERIYKKN
ncbi:MAG: hypothetical protein J0M29_02190 [Chitinophagales bacterium]|nr:hypothetical protein [Chitinophagales bacterium]